MPLLGAEAPVKGSVEPGQSLLKALLTGRSGKTCLQLGRSSWTFPAGGEVRLGLERLLDPSCSCRRGSGLIWRRIGGGGREGDVVSGLGRGNNQI